MAQRLTLATKRGGAAALVACALALTACGDDDSPIEPISTTTTETTTTGGAISQEEFITAGDARCAEANVAIANLGDDSTAISQESAITEGLLGDLQDIGDGEDPDGSLANYYAALKDEVRILEQQTTATNEGDTTTVSSLELDLDAAKSEAATAASAYGFEECGGTEEALSDDIEENPSAETGGVTTTTPVPVPPVTTTPVPVTPAPPVDPGDTGGGTPPVTPPVTPTPTPTPEPGGGSSGGVGPG
jgi:hypothetical protein